MRIVTTTLFVSCLLAVCCGQLLPCAPNCRYEDDGALFPNPRDCTKFFQCDHNIAVPHKCLPGLVFNPVLQICDYPENAMCVEDPDYECNPSPVLPCAPNCRHEDDGVLAPNPRDCTKFYQCASHVAVPHRCPSGLFFNPIAEICDYPDSAGCVQDPDYDCSDGKTTTTAATIETTTVDATTDAATTAPSVTTGDTTTAVYTTSKVLVTTVHSTTTTALGTSTAQPTVTTTKVETTTVQPTVSTTVTSGSTTDSGECTPECPSDEAMFPNPRDCSSFFKCAFGHPFLLQCPAGQWYDAPNERCDYPELAECNAGPDVPCVAVTNPTGPPQETTTAVSGPTTTDGGDDCVPPCPSDEALYPNPRDCGSFYQCAFGVPHLMQCPEGQEYAPALERCDYPEVAECTAGPDVPCVAVTNPTGPPQETTTAVSGPTTTDGGDDCVPPCPSDEALYPNPRDCGSFYQCAFGVPHLMQCPEGQEYAAALERCDYPEVAECTAGPDSPCVAVTIPPQFVARRR